MTTTKVIGEIPEREPVFVGSEVVLNDLPPTTAAFLSADTYVAEGLRAVGTRVRLEWKGEKQTLALTSSVEGDGKTCVSLGLAAALARAGQSVLLIDADLRRRDSSTALGLRPETGLAEWLESAQGVLPVRQIATAGFGLLSAGKVPCRPELLGSPRLAQLLAAARRQYDVVLLDSAPLLPVADTLALRDQVEGFLVVVRARHGPKEALSRAVALLGRAVIGVVMNAYHSRLPMRRGYAYGYGSSYGYGPRYRSYPGPKGRRPPDGRRRGQNGSANPRDDDAR